MTAPPKNLASDVADVLARLQASTGIKASDIVRGSGRAVGHVSARHAAFWLLRHKGHTITAIAEAFGHTRTGVQSSLRRVGFHGRAWTVIEGARMTPKRV